MTMKFQLKVSHKSFRITSPVSIQLRTLTSKLLAMDRETAECFSGTMDTKSNTLLLLCRAGLVFYSKISEELKS